jgi:phosphinothricin acetyltransferase
MLRSARTDDAFSICDIYNHYILHTPATFEEVSLQPEEMRQRIEEAAKSYPWFVWEEAGNVLGYCYGRKWRERAAYRHSAEASIYLHPSAIGKGSGSLLFDALLGELRSRQFHCVIGGVSLPNPARCLKSLDSGRSPTSAKSATNSASGSMWATGSSCFKV